MSYVSQTSESQQASFLIFSPLPNFLILGAASAYLEFESLSLESFILAHFYLDLVSLLDLFSLCPVPLLFLKPKPCHPKALLWNLYLKLLITFYLNAFSHVCFVSLAYPDQTTCNSCLLLKVCYFFLGEAILSLSFSHLVTCIF